MPHLELFHGVKVYRESHKLANVAHDWVEIIFDMDRFPHALPLWVEQQVWRLRRGSTKQGRQHKKIVVHLDRGQPRYNSTGLNIKE